MKNKIRIIIDISMTVLLPLLMAYSLIGETFHEVVGTLIFVLFIVHHIINRKWYGALFTPKRTGYAPSCLYASSTDKRNTDEQTSVYSPSRTSDFGAGTKNSYDAGILGLCAAVHSCRNTSGGTTPEVVYEE